MSLQDRFLKKPKENIIEEKAESKTAAITATETATEPAPLEEKSQDSSPNSSPTVIVTEVDAYIYERLKSQPRTFEAIEARDIELEGNKHQLSLPGDIDKIFKKRSAVGRWINKDKRMIDRAIDIRGWAIVNRVLFPEIPKHYFTANGTVERGDSILGFMPKKRADILRAAPGIRSSERIKNLPVDKWKDGGENYYKPSLTEEKDGETISGGIQPDALKEE